MFYLLFIEAKCGPLYIVGSWGIYPTEIIIIIYSKYTDVYISWLEGQEA